MNNIMHQQLNQLRVISLFKEGDKARLENGFLTIEDKSWLSWIKRQKWLQPWSVEHDSKEETVRYLQQFYVSICQTSEQILSEIIHSAADKKKDKIILAIISLAEKLYMSITGIDNLSKTYRFYPKQCAELKGIIDDYARPTLQLLIPCIPSDKMPRVLAEYIEELALTSIGKINNADDMADE